MGACLLSVVIFQQQVTNNLLSEYLLKNGNFALSQCVALSAKTEHALRQMFACEQRLWSGNTLLQDLRTIIATVN